MSKPNVAKLFVFCVSSIDLDIAKDFKSEEILVKQSFVVLIIFPYTLVYIT